MCKLLQILSEIPTLLRILRVQGCQKIHTVFPRIICSKLPRFIFSYAVGSFCIHERMRLVGAGIESFTVHFILSKKKVRNPTPPDICIKIGFREMCLFSCIKT